MIDPLIFIALDVAILVVVFWGITQLYYRITKRYLEVRLFGLCVRRIELTDIKRITKTADGLSENWVNTLLNIHKRRLVIVRRRGMFKNFVITPRHRYTFKAELKKMIAKRWEEVISAQPQKQLPATIVEDDVLEEKV